jgi:hypothetical protein
LEERILAQIERARLEDPVWVKLQKKQQKQQKKLKKQQQQQQQQATTGGGSGRGEDKKEKKEKKEKEKEKKKLKKATSGPSLSSPDKVLRPLDSHVNYTYTYGSAMCIEILYC